MAIEYLARTAPIEDVVAALRRDGAVAVTELVAPEVVDTVVSELRVGLDAAAPEQQSVFDGSRTRRCNAVLRVAPGAGGLVDHDMVVAVADEILLPHCATYRVSSLTAIEILPGEGGQALHRDDSVYPVELAGMELQIGVMWALSDFTEQNGGTRIVPGSHRFMRSWHLPDVSDWESAVMPKGSVLFYLGSTWHGGGANDSDEPRLGLVNTYCLGWLRQENNQYLETPPEVAAQFRPRLRALLGYTPHGSGDDRLGVFEGECAGWVEQPPEAAWSDDRGQVGSAANAKAQGGS